MTEVVNNSTNNNESFGQFMDMVEDFTFPTTDELAAQQDIASRTPKKLDWNRASFAAKLFYTMERANLPLIESSDSLASFSSNNSLSSLHSEGDLSTTDKLLDALHTLTINNFNSTGNLLTEEERQNSLLHKIHAVCPEFLLRFVASYDEFMHNFDATNEGKAADQDFPKMC